SDRRLRHPVGLGLPLRDHRQHPVRRHHDSADQEHGSGLWRRRQDRAVVVVPLARRPPRPEPHAGWGLRQSHGWRACRAHRPPLSFPDFRLLRHAADGGLDRDLPRLCVVALFLITRGVTTYATGRYFFTTTISGLSLAARLCTTSALPVVLALSLRARWTSSAGMIPASPALRRLLPLPSTSTIKLPSITCSNSWAPGCTCQGAALPGGNSTILTTVS